MIQALIPALLPIVRDVIGRFLPEDKEERAKAEREIQAQLTEHLSKIDLAQLAINKQEASHRSIFVAGWRPFIGWVCGFALAYTYIIQPAAVFVLGQTGHLVTLPHVDVALMMPVLMGLLGLGGLRTFEKTKGVAR